jgi:thymidylate kinase
MQATPWLLLGGVDGSGKSTQAQLLAQALRGRGRQVAIVSIWDLVGQEGVPFTSPSQVQAFLRVLGPAARATFLASAMHEALARVPAGQDLVIWVAGWRKYHATELALGTEPKLLQGLAQGFPTPQLSLHLDLDPELALARKGGQVSGHESGGLGPEGFVAFQRRVAECARQLSPHTATLTRVVDASAPVDEVAEAIAQAVGARWPHLA